MKTPKPMTVDRAVRMVERAFGECTPAPDTTRAQPGTVVDPAGRVWRLRCWCGSHPDRGHEAKPVQRERTVS